MGKGYKYSEEEWKAITKADCVEVAKALGYEFDEKRSDKNALRVKDNAGLFVWRNGKGWYQHSTGERGYAADLVTFAKGGSYKDALDFIWSNVLGRSDYETNKQSHIEYHNSQNAKIEEHTSEFTLPERAQNHRRAAAYLTQTRHIPKDIVSFALKEHILYQEEKYGNCCFVGYDKDNIPRYCAKRSSASGVQFKGEVSGSSKVCGWKIGGALERGAKLYVFEAPIDAMSHAGLNHITGRDWKRDTRLAMGGCSVLPVEQHLSDYPNKYREIVICTDNDERGHKMAKILEEKLSGEYKVTRRCSFGKDWNEDLTSVSETARENGISLSAAVRNFYRREPETKEENFKTETRHEIEEYHQIDALTWKCAEMSL